MEELDPNGISLWETQIRALKSHVRILFWHHICYLQWPFLGFPISVVPRARDVPFPDGLPLVGLGHNEPMTAPIFSLFRSQLE